MRGNVRRKVAKLSEVEACWMMRCVCHVITIILCDVCVFVTSSSGTENCRSLWMPMGPLPSIDSAILDVLRLNYVNGLKDGIDACCR